MRYLSVIILLLFSSIAFAQYSPTVEPNMIEVSSDGITFTDASSYISNIVISVGQVTLPHIYHNRRDDTLTWEAQLGTPYQDQKVTFSFNTVGYTGNKVYIRLSFGIKDDTTGAILITSVMSDPSEQVVLTGKPNKPRNKG